MKYGIKNKEYTLCLKNGDKLPVICLCVYSILTINFKDHCRI